MTAQEAFSFKLLASCEHEAAQYYTLASFSESIFFCCIPGGYHPELKGDKVCYLTWILVFTFEMSSFSGRCAQFDCIRADPAERFLRCRQ